MKVCVFIDTIDKTAGGPSRSVPILAKGLAENGIDVTLTTFKSENMNAHLLDNSKVKLDCLCNTQTVEQLKTYFINNEFDIIHLQGIWLPIFHKAAKAARKAKIPYLTTPRGALEPHCYINSSKTITKLKKQLAMILYQRNDIEKASCVLTTADMEMISLRNLHLNVPIAVIPNGIDIAEYPCRPLDSITSCKKQVIFLSRIVDKKGVDILIDAWTYVHEKYPEWNLLIVGNGEQRYIDVLSNRIKINRLDSCIQILPPAFGKEKYKLYTESSFFVLPTHSENFGMVIAEALSCGLPVLTTKGTPWEILERTNTGWWIELSKENLEQTITKVMSQDLVELFSMGQRGSIMIKENFHYTNVAKRLIEVYEWILKKCPKPQTVSIVE